MKLVFAFVLPFVAAACSSNQPRTWWPSPAADAGTTASVASSRSAASTASFEALPSFEASPAFAQDHAHDERSGAQLELLLGMRFFDEDDFEPVEDQPAFGIGFAYEPPGSALGFEVGLMGSYEEDEVLGADLETAVGELYAGVRKTFGGVSRDFRPYIGGGIAALTVDVELGGASDDDTSLGAYVHGGVLGQVGRTFFVGFDARALFGADIELAGVDVDSDYLQLALVLGWAF